MQLYGEVSPMKTLFGRAGISGIVLALVLAATSAAGQKGAHAAVVPQASRQVAPALKLADSSGTNMQVTDYRGKVVLLNFWATDCGGCKL